MLTLLAAAITFVATLMITVGFYQASHGRKSRARVRIEALEAYSSAKAEGAVPLALRHQAGGWVERTHRDMERAGLALKFHEYLALRLMCALVLVAFGFLIGGGGGFALVIAIVLGLLGFMLPALWVRMRINRMVNRTNEQMEEMITMVSNSLRSGLGLLQAFDLASQQMQPPLSRELQRLIRDTRVGASLEEALVAMAERIGSYDLDVIVTAILIQRSVGSNLSEVLDKVAHTIRERARIKGEIQTLTAQKKLSGWIVGLLPLAFVGIIAISAPDYMEPLFTTGAGRLLLVLAAVLDIIGMLVIRRIVNVEV